MAVENDIVLIHLEDQPVFFARIESIVADHKPGWYHVKLLILQVPLQVATWILRDAYLNGGEFTMGGNRMRLEKVVCPEDPGDIGREDSGRDAKNFRQSNQPDKPKIISLHHKKKNIKK